MELKEIKKKMLEIITSNSKLVAGYEFADKYDFDKIIDQILDLLSQQESEGKEDLPKEVEKRLMDAVMETTLDTPDNVIVNANGKIVKQIGDDLHMLNHLLDLIETMSAFETSWEVKYKILVGDINMQKDFIKLKQTN